MKGIQGLVVGIRTKVKANKEGEVNHTTRVTIEFDDLDRPILDQLAQAEVWGNLLSIELLRREEAI